MSVHLSLQPSPQTIKLAKVVILLSEKSVKSDRPVNTNKFFMPC